VDPYTLHVRYKQPYAKALQSWAHLGPAAPRPRDLRQGGAAARGAARNRSNAVGTGSRTASASGSRARRSCSSRTRLLRGAGRTSRASSTASSRAKATIFSSEGMGVDSAARPPPPALQFTRQADFPAFRKAYNKFSMPTTCTRTRVQPQRPALRRQARPATRSPTPSTKRELNRRVRLGARAPATGPYKPAPGLTTRTCVRIRTTGEGARDARRRGGGSPAPRGFVKDGQPVRIRAPDHQGNDERRKVAEIVQASLKEPRRKVDIQVIEWASFLKELHQEEAVRGDHPGPGRRPRSGSVRVWHSSVRPDRRSEPQRLRESRGRRDAREGRASCRRGRAQEYSTGSRKSWPTGPTDQLFCLSGTRCRRSRADPGRRSGASERSFRMP